MLGALPAAAAVLAVGAPGGCDFLVVASWVGVWLGFWVGVWVVWVFVVGVVGGVWWWLLGLGVFCFVLFVVFWCVCGWVCLFWGWLVGLWWGCWLCGVVRGCGLLFGGWLVCGWGFGLGCGLWFAVWCSAWGVLVVLGEWHGVGCLLPGGLYVVGAVVGGVSAACAVGVWVWVGCGLVGVGVGAGWWVLCEVVGVCVFLVEEGGGLGGGLGFADLLPFEVVEAAGGVECSVDGCCCADCGGLALVGGECGGGVHVGVCLLGWGLLGWWCGVVPVLKWALEEDEGCCVGCG